MCLVLVMKSMHQHINYTPNLLILFPIHFFGAFVNFQVWIVFLTKCHLTLDNRFHFLFFCFPQSLYKLHSLQCAACKDQSVSCLSVLCFEGQGANCEPEKENYQSSCQMLNQPFECLRQVAWKLVNLNEILKFV